MKIDGQRWKFEVLVFLGIYFLFVISISISISIAYTEYVYFHKYIFNNYVAGKIFVESFRYSVVLFITAGVFNQLLHYLNIYKLRTEIDKDGNPFKIKNNIFLNILIFLVSAIVALPIKTIVTAFFYEGEGSTFFRLAFVHLNSQIKVISAVIIFLIFIFYILKKYKFTRGSLILLIAVLVLPTGYFIWTTRGQNFEALEMKIQAISGEGLFLGGYLIDKGTGEKMKPYAEKLLTIASNKEQESSAYFWLSRAESRLNNGDKALDYINRAIALNPTSGDYMAKSEIQRGLQNFTEARKSAEKCLEIATEKNNAIPKGRCESEIALSYLDEGYITYNYLKKDYFVNAKLHIEKAIVLDPEQTYYKIALNQILISDAVSDFYLKNYDEALKKINIFLNSADTFKSQAMISRAYATKGDIEGFNGDYKNALLDLKKSLEYSSRDTKAIYVDIGLVYEHLSNNKSAVLYYDKALDFDPKDIDTPSNSVVLEQKNRAQGKL